MPIYFEKTSRGESSILSIYGTEDDIEVLAKSLKEGLALRSIRKDGESKLEVRAPELKSSTFDQIEIVVADREEVQAIAKAGNRKKLLIFAIWLAIIIAIIFLYSLK